ncbi:MAG: stealth family protein [Alphaproteobacteria bacterium]|nr:stealth family protein [Alphaproteobacteria bacterium]
MKKIDIVYLWVDGSDKKWAEQKEKWYKTITGKTPVYQSAASIERFRDNGELLYSFRSVAENLPWINHIYLVTGFNQVPKWLNTKHKKITIIPHEQIFPPDALPTFNATAIEMCISNIKNLSEHFLLFNDDVFINKKLKPSFFYDNHDRALVYYNKHRNYQNNIEKWKQSVDEYTQTLILSSQQIEKTFGKTFYIGRPSHGVDPYFKSSIIKCMNHPTLKPLFEAQIRNKFRTNNEFQRWIFNIYDYINGRAVLKHCHPYKSKHTFDFIYNTIHLWSSRHSPLFCENVSAAKNSIKHSAIFCINDSAKSGPEILKHNQEFLSTRFPNKCEFEK